MFGFGIIEPFDEGIVTALEIRLVNGYTGIFVDGIPYHAGDHFHFLPEFLFLRFQTVRGEEHFLDGLVVRHDGGFFGNQPIDRPKECRLDGFIVHMRSGTFLSVVFVVALPNDSAVFVVAVPYF